MNYNAGNEDDVSKEEEKAELDRKQRLSDIKALLATPYGLRYMQWLMDEGMIFRTSFTGNSHTFFNEGRRALALKIFHEVQFAAPHMIEKLMIRKEEDLKK